VLNFVIQNCWVMHFFRFYVFIIIIEVIDSYIAKEIMRLTDASHLIKSSL
jgi:hypothetical protein